MKRSSDLVLYMLLIGLAITLLRILVVAAMIVAVVMFFALLWRLAS